MKYVATGEIEFKTDADPLEELHHIMLGRSRSNWDIKYADRYHIVEQPRELK